MNRELKLFRSANLANTAAIRRETIMAVAALGNIPTTVILIEDIGNGDGFSLFLVA